MKTRLVFSPILLTLIALLVACSPGSAPSIRSVQLLPFTLSLKPGESIEVQAVVFGDATNKTVTWSSSNPEVVQVNTSGLVTGLKTGQATITATSRADNSKKGSATVTVTAPEVSNISIQLDGLTLGLGGKRTLSALVEGSSGVDTAVTWASSDETIATVSATGEVAAVALGSTSITATSVADSSKSATMQVSVVQLALDYTDITATVGRLVSRNPSLTGGNPGFTFEVLGTSLPSWLTLDAGSGNLTGTPTTPLDLTNFTIRITDSDGSVATETFSLRVNAEPALAYPTSSTFPRNASTTLTPSSNSGGTLPKVYSVDPALPAGLSLNTETGVITGTPTAISPATSYTVTVSDANGATANNSFSLAISSNLSLTYTATRALTVGRAIVEGAAGNYTRAVTGAVGTITYDITSASPPAWLSLSATTGVLSGTPTGSGSFPITVRVRETSGASPASATSSFTLVVNPTPTLTFTQARALTAGRPVVAANYTLNSALGVAPYTYAATGITATGLALDAATGIITGTPSAATVTAGTLSFSVVATDANGAATTPATITFTVNPAPTLAYPSTNLRTIGGPITPIIPTTDAGGTGTKTYALASGTLPTGLALSTTTGAISGTPTAITLAPVSITVSATDANGAVVTSTAFSITINAAPSPSP